MPEAKKCGRGSWEHSSSLCDELVLGAPRLELVVVFYRQKARARAGTRHLQVARGEVGADLVHEALELDRGAPVDLLRDAEERPGHVERRERRGVEGEH